MAMISIKNLVAPVSNSVHLATIFFLAFFFGVWRWSNGEVNFVKGGRATAPRSIEREQSRDELKFLEPQREQQPSKTNSIVVPERAADDLLQSILKKPNNSAAQERKAPERDSANRGRSGSSLEDIERSLGISNKK